MNRNRIFFVCRLISWLFIQEILRRYVVLTSIYTTKHLLILHELVHEGSMAVIKAFSYSPVYVLIKSKGKQFFPCKPTLSV